MLASRGRDLALATRLAQQALLIEDDPTLRVELAGWLAGLGKTIDAANTLRDLVRAERPAEAARTIVKIAVLLARGGQAGAAAEALDEAAALDPNDAMGVELFGTLTAWAPEIVTKEGAAAAYLEAARRRAAAGDEDAAYEDRLRAFDIAPHDHAAAEAVAEALRARRHAAAADEVMRLHAATIGAAPPNPAASTAQDDQGHHAANGPRPLTEPVLAIHRRRMLTAIEDGDPDRAVGAILDAGLEGQLDGPDAGQVDLVAFARGAPRAPHGAHRGAVREDLGRRARGRARRVRDPPLREAGHDGGDPQAPGPAGQSARRVHGAGPRDARGPRAERAIAIEHIAGPARAPLRAILLAVAADLYARDAPDAARVAALHACEADPMCARALTTLSSIPDPTPHRVSAEAIERAMTRVVPRGAWCEELSRVLDALGDPAAAFSWTQRWVALCPGAPRP